MSRFYNVKAGRQSYIDRDTAELNQIGPGNLNNPLETDAAKIVYCDLSGSGGTGTSADPYGDYSTAAGDVNGTTKTAVEITVSGDITATEAPTQAASGVDVTVTAGLNFENISDISLAGAGNPSARDIAWHSDDIVVVGDLGSIWTSHDNGDSFTKTAALAGNGFTKVLRVDTDTWLTARASEVYRSTDNGDTWSYLQTIAASGGGDFLVYDMQQEGDRILICGGLTNTLISYSTDRGATFTNKILVSSGSRAHMCAIKNGNFIIAVDQDIYLSTNDGVSFASSFDLSSISTDNFNAFNNYISDDGSNLYIGSYAVGSDRGFLKSSDSGVSWSHTLYPTSYMTGPVGYYDGLLITHGSYRLAVSSDYGSTWTVTTNPSSGANDFLTYSDSKLITISKTSAGTYLEGSVSYDRGATWESWDSPITTASSDVPTGIFSKDRLYLLSGNNSSNIVERTKFAIIDHNLSNCTIDECEMFGVDLYHCQVRADIDFNATGKTVKNCKLKGSTITVASINISDSVIDGDLTLDATGIAAGADISIENCTITGKLDVTVASDAEAGRLRIRDTIIDGGAECSHEFMNIDSGNVRGTLINVTQTPGQVYQTNPLYVDAANSDYRLRRESDGFETESPLIAKSVYSTYIYSSDTYPRDLGAYSVNNQLAEIRYQRAWQLLKPNSVSEGRQLSRKLLISRDGTPDSLNNPEAQVEIIAFEYSADDVTGSKVRELVEYMDSIRRQTVELQIDPDHVYDTALTVSGAHDVSDIAVSITSAAVQVSSQVKIEGVMYTVTAVYPSESATTKIVLDRFLETALTGGESIDVYNISGHGTYQYVSNSRTQNRTWSQRDDLYSGVQFKFARKVER